MAETGRNMAESGLDEPEKSCLTINSYTSVTDVGDTEEELNESRVQRCRTAWTSDVLNSIDVLNTFIERNDSS
jgi:hypothetical protein